MGEYSTAPRSSSSPRVSCATRWPEQANSGQYLPAAEGKCDVSRQMEAAQSELRVEKVAFETASPGIRICLRSKWLTEGNSLARNQESSSRVWTLRKSSLALCFR